MPTRFQVIDLFAGPGGLAEGFSAFRDKKGSRPFEMALSVEKESPAHQTLTLRNFLRKFADGFPPQYYQYLNEGGDEPDWASLYPREWTAATTETLQLELGTDSAKKTIRHRLAELKQKNGNACILIGGPPCQAYSLVGRARNKGIKGYSAREDKRHFLYKEYIEILRTLRPIAFVMENVKGILSARVDGELIFDLVLNDLQSPNFKDEYELFPVLARDMDKKPLASDFVLRSEHCGIPQARHRVIVVGIRRDIARKIPPHIRNRGLVRESFEPVTVGAVIGGMPKLRSGLSRSDTSEAWIAALVGASRQIRRSNINLTPSERIEFQRILERCQAEWEGKSSKLRRSPASVGIIGPDCPKDLSLWLRDKRLKTLSNSDTRGHMASDLSRYLFAAIYSRVADRSPKASDFPQVLAPLHSNWDSGKFADRFRVQRSNYPATTVTSHIAKDGHYFIHPDPMQCRSLTVREAARLQTFPDNYLFKGNRTEQYVQVGNAVPPFVAYKLAAALHAILG
ncbi:DNA cytosine methyltransferase [Tardiphaga sp. 11_C7_N12_6]|uniref:DNA cytosine methyltransferase n=1 Tax=Tardiphaga sp. 11_C7_N12_6 TaxID=3240789 RepID=UPI003F28B773